ncbi:hypothetical protein GCM10010448_25360 [Streptomyces glomeratus]|uniref:Uncharacterized protein n=1 Tax=Streptomyces glomeratus TaxID=284452 RepID=A0ABP6LHJ8_9ACTN
MRTAGSAEAEPAAATLSATEPKSTASAVAAEVLRMRTVMKPPQEIPGSPGDESAARHPDATAA